MDHRIARCATLPACALSFACIACAQPAADAGVAAHGLAGAVTAREGSAYALWNPAAAEERASIVRASCRVTSGGLAGLFVGAIVGTHPVDTVTTVSIGLSGESYLSYRAVGLLVSAQRALAHELSVGVDVRFETQSIDGYGTRSAVLVDAGMLATLHQSLRVGVIARNVALGQLRGITRPQHIGVALLTAIDDSAELSIDIIHEVGRGVDVATGIESRIASGLRLRAGIDLASPTVACGVGYDNGRLLIDVATSWSGAVGVSYLAGAGLRW